MFLLFVISASVFFLRQIYELLVLETKPRDAVSIIECDMQVKKAMSINKKVLSDNYPMMEKSLASF